MAFQLFAIFVIGVQSQFVLPKRCPVLNLQCVGEGSTCNDDFDSGCDPNTQSVCRLCADDSLTCHGGKCMKKTQGRGETCSDQLHLWCQPAFECTNTGGGTCYDPNTASAPSSFLARGETCQTSNDCYNTVCDPFVNKCVNQNIDTTTTQEALCSYWSDCVWEEYCSPTDTTTSPSIPATCKPVPGGFGNRGGAYCKPTANYYNPTGQCGWSQFCMAQSDETHAAFTAFTCQQPYSIPEGGVCPNDIAANQIYIGDGYYYNQQPISFCASGSCKNNRCANPDYTYAGTGCRNQDECGRGMQCACAGQGGRARCIPDNTQQGWEIGRSEWFQKLQPWFTCLENNKCTLNSAEVGSCGYTHCKDQIQPKPVHTCSTATSDPRVNIPNYRGYLDTMGAGAHMVPSFVMITAIMATIYALIH